MIRELHLRVQPQNKKANVLFYVCFALTFVLFAASYAMASYRWILQMASVGCLVTAILVYTKFICAIYYYEILLDSRDIPMLVVRQQTGRRSTTLCRVDLTDIVKTERLTREAYRARKVDVHKHRYVYTPSLLPDTVHLLTVISRHETAEIVLEGSEEFIEYLRSCAELARTLYPRDEEE